MDIHRCRFVPYPPSGINALAFSHLGNAATKGRGPATLRLAVGRANGDIEIWNPNQGTWFQETVLRGGRDRSIEGLVWTQDVGEAEADSGLEKAGKLRLFSIGYSTTVTEWDLEKGQPAQHSGGNYGEIWCLAAQPKWQPRRDKHTNQPLPAAEGEYRGQHLAAGCADGAIVILSTEDGELQYLRTMRPSTRKARVLSITFQDRNTIIAGYADSTIRVFDIRNGQLLRNMSLGNGLAGGPRNILVWSVKCLPDGTIVSGDSTGQLKFWDAKTYSLSQRIQSHVADVLDLATSPDGESVVSGGADRRTIVYKRGGNKGDKQRRWAELMHRRYHSNDVKALAVFETREISIVVAGGPDTMPVLIPLREFGNENHRTLPSLPQIPQVSSAPTSRCVMSWWEREVSIWRVSRNKQVNSRVSEGPKFKLVAKILVKGDESVTSATLSPRGDLLVVATVADIKVFTLRAHKRPDHPGLRVQQVEVPSTVTKEGARLVTISPNNQWLCIVRPNSDVFLAKLIVNQTADENPKILSRPIKLNRLSRSEPLRIAQFGTHGHYERAIRCAEFSAESNILAVSDISGHLDTWVLEGLEDPSLPVDKEVVNGREASPSEDDSSDDEETPRVIQGQHWIQNPAARKLPKLSSAILFISFRPQSSKDSSNGNGNITLHPTRHNPHPHSHDLPSGEDRLVVLTVDHKFYEFEVLKGSLTDWSKRNPASSFPSQFFGIKERAMGCTWDTDNGNQRIWIYGVSWVFMFDLSKDFPPLENTGFQLGAHDVFRQGFDKKRKRGDEEQGTLKISNSGAGDSTSLSKSYIGLGSKIRKTVGPATSNSEFIPLQKTNPDRNSDDDDEDQDENEDVDFTNDVVLSKLRREGIDIDAEAETKVNGTKADHMDDTSTALVSGEKTDKTSPSWWHTHRYRDILGLVPVGHSSSYSNGTTTEDEKDGLLEVVLIERPIWDVDLPPSYYGDEDLR